MANGNFVQKTIKSPWVLAGSSSYHPGFQLVLLVITLGFSWFFQLSPWVLAGSSSYHPGFQRVLLVITLGFSGFFQLSPWVLAGSSSLVLRFLCSVLSTIVCLFTVYFLFFFFCVVCFQIYCFWLLFGIFKLSLSLHTTVNITTLQI